MARFLGQLPRSLLDGARWATLAALACAAAWGLLRRRQAGRGVGLVLLESLLLAGLLGPLLGWLVGQSGLSAVHLPTQAPAPIWLPPLLSVGAGIWEELVFRLGLLGGLTFLFGRLTNWQPAASFAVALMASALMFALYHHLGPGGEPLAADRFAFRSLAGILLGLVFARRGLAVVVYMHVFYDLLCDLRQLLS